MQKRKKEGKSHKEMFLHWGCYDSSTQEKTKHACTGLLDRDTSGILGKSQSLVSIHRIQGF